MRRILSTILALLLLLSFASCTQNLPAEVDPPQPQQTDLPSEPLTEHIAKSYADVIAALKETRVSRGATGGYAYAANDNGVAFVEKQESFDMVAETTAAVTPTMAKNETADGDFSDTNTQVSGIDEADIVKTDGEYIYILRDNYLTIMAADGENSEVISKTLVGTDYSVDYGYDKDNPNKYINEMFLQGDRLILIGTKSIQNEEKQFSECSCLDIYDIGDRANIELLSSLGQDGYYSTSRFVNGIVYMISNYYVYSDPAAFSEASPRFFVPCTYTGNDGVAILPDSIAIMPRVESSAYTVVASYDIEGEEILSSLSLLGGGDNVYMSANNIYVAGYNYETEESETYTSGIYKVVDYTNKQTTTLARIELAENGEIIFAAEGSVDGSLLNQFSMDEYDANLRVVTTCYNDSYSIYTDEEMGFENYKWSDNAQTNALYVLNPDLEIIGSITGLAEDERVYSVRFDGDVGYFVTFRQVDPLFAVDLSDAENPEIKSELKIPGFSEYLHPYAEGRLFGLGRDADEKSGRAGFLKLSMFDTSDKSDVSERFTLIIDGLNYSSALNNHKAILVAPEKNLIAFPAENSYQIYTYDDENGFTHAADINFDDWSYDSRGLYIGNFAYIISYNSVTVLDMGDFSISAELEF